MRKENAKPVYLHKISKEHFIFWKSKYGKYVVYFYYSLSIKNENGNNHEVLNIV